MPDPEEVRTALARLAAGDPRAADVPPGTLAGPPAGRNPRSEAGATLPPEDAAAVVDVAAESVEDLDAAAAFASAGGVALLARVTERAAARGEVDVARRGQRALAAFQWVRRAAGDAPAPDGSRDPDESDPAPSTTSTPVTEPL